MIKVIILAVLIITYLLCLIYYVIFLKKEQIPNIRNLIQCMMSKPQLIYNEAELKKYFDGIKDRFLKTKRYISILGFWFTILVFSGVGIVPAWFINTNIDFLNYSPYQPFFLLFTWIIFACIEIYPLFWLSKKIVKTSLKPYDNLFCIAFSAYQNIKYEDAELLKKASQLLKDVKFNTLKTNIDSAYKVPGLKKEWIKRIDKLLSINKEYVIPRLDDGIEIEEIKPLVGNFAQFLYSQNNENIKLQVEVVKDSVIRAVCLEKYEKKKLDIKSQTYFSQNPIISMLSFTFSIAVLLVVTGYILLKINIIIPGTEPVSYYTIGSISISILGGIGLANLCKK